MPKVFTYLHAKINNLYELNATDSCCGHSHAQTLPSGLGQNTHVINLDNKKGVTSPKFNAVRKAFGKATEAIHANGGFSGKDLDKPAIKALTTATFNALKTGLDFGITHQMPDALKASLANDVFVFSGFKTYAQLKEASGLLLDKDGNRKSLAEFKADILAIDSKYNLNYLTSEYQFAMQSATMADKWQDLAKDGDKYNLQYRTANDDRVRESHRILQNTTLPASHPFWQKYYPPNGWRCRCNAVQVLKAKYKESNGDEAIKNGETATTQLDKNGKNSAAMFRFNPGTDKVIFPPNHPYSKVTPTEAKKVIAKQADAITGLKPGGEKPIKIKTLLELEEVVKDFADKKPEYFARGFKEIKPETKEGNNGSTDMWGKIYLKQERIDNVISGINNINKGLPTTFNQEDAISTLWHEITHNANKVGNIKLTDIEKMYMEIANEFVSRNTLPTFMEALGGELQNDDLMTFRKSTGYNRMVVNYQKLIEWAEADKTKVLETVKTHLFNESYDKQLEGLIKGLVDNTPHKINSINNLMLAVRNNTNKDFEKILQKNAALLIKNGK